MPQPLRTKARPWTPPPALNPGLYARLSARFGRVRIGNEGVAATEAAPRLDPRTGRLRADFVDLGEYYICRCPFCNDTEGKLWVNHRWMQPDPVSGEPMRHLAICYRGCLAEHYADFEARVTDEPNASTRRKMLSGFAIMPGLHRDFEVSGHVGLPGDCVRIDELPADHKAVAYLEGRGFAVAELAEAFEVAYCRSCPEYPSAANRIIIPVRFKGDRVTWQGRWPADLRWKEVGIPKYYNLPNAKKSKVLYNHDRASAFSPKLVVVVEGVVDVWAGGDPFVSTLGKSVSETQRLLLSAWASRGGLCILLFDPGAFTTEVPASIRDRVAAKYADLVSSLRESFEGRLLEAKLPEGTDPGSYARAPLWRLLEAQAAAAGFDLAKFKGG